MIFLARAPSRHSKARYTFGHGQSGLGTTGASAKTHAVGSPLLEMSPRGLQKPVVTELDLGPAVTEQFGLIRMSVLHTWMSTPVSSARPSIDSICDLFNIMQLQHAGSIDRALFEVFLVYVLSGDRPIAEIQNRTTSGPSSGAPRPALAATPSNSPLLRAFAQMRRLGVYRKEMT